MALGAQPIPLRAEGLTADAPFSYICHRCRRCCHGKLIQVNPYEIARLARGLSLSTTEFISRYLEPTLPYLRRKEENACVFLGPEGCTVHPDRPLVCRVYPLGQHVTANAPEEATRYAVVEGHPQSEGIFGKDGTISDYLAGQGVAPFVAAARAYLSALQALFDVWQDRGNEAGSPPELLDMDLSIREHCIRCAEAEPTDIEVRMALHLRIIQDWIRRREQRAAFAEEKPT